MRNQDTQEMVQEGMEEIEKMAPQCSHVEIDVVEDPAGNFRTHILLSTKHKNYFAKKEDIFVYKSFAKAMRAIKAQIHKKKFPHEGLRSIKRRLT